MVNQEDVKGLIQVFYIFYSSSISANQSDKLPSDRTLVVIGRFFIAFIL